MIGLELTYLVAAGRCPTDGTICTEESSSRAFADSPSALSYRMHSENAPIPSYEASSLLLQWTEDSPREEGFFWYAEPEFGLLEIVQVYAGAKSDGLRASGRLIARRPLDTMDGKWAGPIPPPRC